MELFYKGNAVRHVGSTKMNAESSRSHLIFAIMIDNYDKQTKKTSHGKFSFIDLAGSERVGKTGANAARLREAKVGDLLRYILLLSILMHILLRCNPEHNAL